MLSKYAWYFHLNTDYIILCVFLVRFMSSLFLSTITGLFSLSFLSCRSCQSKCLSEVSVGGSVRILVIDNRYCVYLYPE